MDRVFGATVALLLTLSAAEAAERRGMRVWNLTLYTLTSLQFSAPGQNAWGKNQCENDDDKTVDHNERLRITGLTPGLYDAKLTDKIGRTCVVKGVEVKDGIFTIEEKQLTNCERK
ncbi:MAG TPA: hypothetical protein VJT13_21395 [Xanthobacteraceae bacterium]|nr:hypothetical protein [Xanthobacteraceae bacterium]